MLGGQTGVRCRLFLCCTVYGFAIFVVVTNALFDLASSDKINQDSERLYYQFFGEKYDLNL